MVYSILATCIVYILYWVWQSARLIYWSHHWGSGAAAGARRQGRVCPVESIRGSEPVPPRA